MAKRILESSQYLDIQQFVTLKDGYYTLNFRNGSYSVRKSKGMYWIEGQRFYTSKTTVGYGERTWFVCPLCDCNVKRLYIPHNHANIACRTCNNLTYYKSRVSGNELEYVTHQIEQIQKLFDMSHSYQYGGLPGCVYEQIPLVKPKYMRWKQFYELQNELKRLINKRIDAWMRSLKL